MHGVPRLPRPHPGRLYDCSRIVRWLRSMFLPSDLLIVQVVPRSREMNNWRPPIITVDGLCGESRIGVFQLNWLIASASGVFSTLPRPPRPPPPPPPCASCGGGVSALTAVPAAAAPAPAAPAAPAPPPRPPPPRPPPPPPAPAAAGKFGLMFAVWPVFRSYRL